MIYIGPSNLRPPVYSQCSENGHNNQHHQVVAHHGASLMFAYKSYNWDSIASCDHQY